MLEAGEQVVLTLSQVASALERAGLTLGLLLGAALLSGMVAERLRLPKVTAYLFVGLLMGPHTIASLPTYVLQYIPPRLQELVSIPEVHRTFLAPMAKFAMALVLFNMGCSFAVRHIRAHWKSIIRLSAGELSLTFLLVCSGLMLLGESWAGAILFGALALATAPATTVLVFKESQSEGPITRYANTLVALNNVMAIVVFEILLVAILALHGRAESSVMISLARLLLDLFSSVALGVLAGLAVALASAFLSRSRWLVMLVSVSSVVLGICQQVEIPYLLTFLIMGTTVANTSSRAKDIVAQMDQLTGLLCVVFFVIHGTEMDVNSLLAAGTIGLGYILLRTAGKYFGIYFATTANEGEAVKHWLGATILAQAGAAIALVAIAAERYPELGGHLQVVILGTVIVFEIVGPIMIRQAVVRTGEVPLDVAIHHSDTTLRDELNSLWMRLMLALGVDAWRSHALESLTIDELMRRDVRGIPASATYRRVVDFIERSHDNMLPVIDEEGSVVGMISYSDLRDEHFDPGLGPLVRATDLVMTSYPLLHPDESAMHAWREFKQSNADCLAVVTRERPHRLLGILRRRDLQQLTTGSV